MSDIEKNDSVENDAFNKTEQNESADKIIFEDALNEVAEKKDQKKNAKVDKRLAEALAERDDFKDKYQRTFSEFNNYKKRMASTRAEAIKDGQCDAITKILPVLDTFERALEHIESEQDSALAQGFKMVYKQLTLAIEQLGVAELGAPGDLFDPNLHQAIQMVDAQEGEKSGTVAGVAQKGYKMDDRVVRHCMVMVNK
jgi:molecular chaperone GrpE